MDEAKLIFLKYDGNYYQMHREGEYEKYKKYNISKIVEREWFDEILMKITEEIKNTSNNRLLSSYFDKYGFVALQFKSEKTLEFMLSIIEQRKCLLDSNTLFRCVNTMLDYLATEDSFAKKRDVVKQMLEILEKILNNPITISEDYKENGEMPDYLVQEKIICNIKETINYWQNELKII